MSIENAGSSAEKKPSNNKQLPQKESIENDDDELIEKMLSQQQDAQKKNREMMKEFYNSVFPFELIERWLCYLNTPKSKTAKDPTYFCRREFSFTLENEAYLRYQFCGDWQELKQKVVKFNPQKIDIGAVFFTSPKSTNFGFTDDDENTANKPVEREFIIDIDMDDYNEIRTCCKDATVCKKCWKFMQAACSVLNDALQWDFGFHSILWFFSGRRGIHAWVCDYRARIMSNDQRSAVVEYLRLVSVYLAISKLILKGNDKSGTDTDTFSRSVEKLKEVFPEIVIKDQQILRHPEKGPKILEFLRSKCNLDEEKVKEYRKIMNHNVDDPEAVFERLLECINRDIPEGKKKYPDRFPVEELILNQLYPRIDINVSKGMNHLLKCPFCVHPKSKKISVPIIDIKNFDPDRAPTLEQTIIEREDGVLGNIKNLELSKPYIDFFLKFIKNKTEKEAEVIGMMEMKDKKESAEKMMDF